MARNFARQTGTMKESANEERFYVDDLKEPTLNSSDRFYPVFEVTGTNTRSFAPGYGHMNENFAQGYADLDLQNATPAAIEGKGRWVLYSDSTKEDPLAISGTFSLANLRSAVAEARKDKVLMEGLAPAGSDDRTLVFEVSPASGSEGDTVTAANSDTDLGIPYSLFR